MNELVHFDHKAQEKDIVNIPETGSPPCHMVSTEDTQETCPHSV